MLKHNLHEFINGLLGVSGCPLKEQKHAITGATGGWFALDQSRKNRR